MAGDEELVLRGSSGSSLSMTSSQHAALVAGRHILDQDAEAGARMTVAGNGLVTIAEVQAPLVALIACLVECPWWPLWPLSSRSAIPPWPHRGGPVPATARKHPHLSPRTSQGQGGQERDLGDVQVAIARCCRSTVSAGRASPSGTPPKSVVPVRVSLPLGVLPRLTSSVAGRPGSSLTIVMVPLESPKLRGLEPQGQLQVAARGDDHRVAQTSEAPGSRPTKT